MGLTIKAIANSCRIALFFLLHDTPFCDRMTRNGIPAANVAEPCSYELVVEVGTAQWRSLKDVRPHQGAIFAPYRQQAAPRVSRALEKTRSPRSRPIFQLHCQVQFAAAFVFFTSSFEPLSPRPRRLPIVSIDTAALSLADNTLSQPRGRAGTAKKKKWVKRSSQT